MKFDLVICTYISAKYLFLRVSKKFEKQYFQRVVLLFILLVFCKENEKSC